MKVTKLSLPTRRTIDQLLKSEDQESHIDTDIKNIILALQGRIRFGDGTTGDRGENVSGEFLTVTTNATPDTETSFSHTLGAVPVGYIVLSKDKAGVIYDGTTSWTSSAIYLRSNVASVTAKVFLLK